MGFIDSEESVDDETVPEIYGQSRQVVEEMHAPTPSLRPTIYTSHSAQGASESTTVRSIKRTDRSRERKKHSDASS